MKIYAYDPSTGKRGDVLDVVRVATWADCGVQHSIKMGNLKDMGWKSPASNAVCEHTMHVDGGVSDVNGKPVSYQRETEWVAYCVGQWFAGETGVWQWVILPSRADLNSAKIK